MELLPGTIILSRNIDEAVNDQFPGYFNHCSLALSPTTLIEAMESDGGVIVNRISDIIDHPETGEYAFCWPNDPRIGDAAATFAYQFVGLPYRKLASIRIFLRGKSKGENCVSLVRRSYKEATGRDPGFRIADDVWDSRLFTTSEIYKTDNYIANEDQGGHDGRILL